jgi:hypothetical protein
MRGVYIVGCLAGVGLATWLAIIIINGVRNRIKIVNERKRRSIK